MQVQATIGRTPSAMNKAIIDNNVLGTKAEQEAKFAKFAKEKNNTDYMNVVAKIDEAVAKTSPSNINRPV